MSGRSGLQGALNVSAGGRGGKHRRHRQPYSWLGTGAVTLGVGVAVIQGAGIAHADEGSGGSKAGSAASPSHAAAKKPPVKKTVQSPSDDGSAPSGDASASDASGTPKKAPRQNNSNTAHQKPAGQHSAVAKVLDAPAALPARVSAPAPVAAVAPVTPPALKVNSVVAQPVSAVAAQPSGGSGTVSTAAAVAAAGVPVVAKAVAATGPVAPAAPLTVAPLALLMGSAYSQSNSSGSVTTAPAAVVTTGAPPAPSASPVIATIPVDPYSIVITKDGKTLYGTSSPYATDPNGIPIGTVEVVNTATNTQVGSPITVGAFIGNGNIATNPTMNRAYVTAYNQFSYTTPGGTTATGYAPSLVVIDTSTNKVVGDPIILATLGSNGVPTTQFSPGPNGALAVSPDGSRVYLAGTTITTVVGQPQLQPTMLVFDANSNTQIGSPISLAPASSNVYAALGGASVLVSPTGNRLYVTLLSTQSSGNSSQPTLTSTIYTVDPHSGTTIGNPIVLPDNVLAIMPGTNEALSPDGTKLYVESLPYSSIISSGSTTPVQSAQQVANASVLSYNTSTGQQIGAPIDVVGFGAMSISNDGKTLYVADIADSRTGKTAVYQPISNTPGQAIYLGSVSAYDLATGKTVGNPTAVGLYPTSMAINSAGNRLYVANMGDNTISVIDITGGNSGNLTPIAKIVQAVTAAVQRAAIQVQTVVTNVLSTAIHVQQQVVAQIQQVAKSVQNAAVHVQQQVAAQVQQIVKTVSAVIGSLVKSVTNVVHPPSPPANVSIKLSAADLLNRINTNVPDGIRIDKVVSSDGTRLVVYMSGVKGGINGLSDNAAVQEMNGIPDPKMSNFINNTVDSLGGPSKIKEIMLVGFSKGGMMAQDYAASGKYKNKVTTIVTFAAPLVKKANEYNADALHIEAANDYVPRDEGATWFIYVDGGWHMQFSHPDARQSLDGNTGDNKSIYVANTGNKHPDNAYHNKDNYLIAANDFTAEVKKNPAKWAAITTDINRFAGTIVGPSRTANF